MTPIQIFIHWYDEELKQTNVRIQSACCLSTIGLDGYPNARFVSLKEIVDERFIVTGPLNSRKGSEILHSNKVALTFWWTSTERQVRIQGEATEIPNEHADKYFSERAVDSQIVSLISEQGKIMDSVDDLNEKYREAEISFNNNVITRPDNWGGYSIKPIRIELMEFKPNRFHDRKLYEIIDRKWIAKQLQP